MSRADPIVRVLGSVAPDNGGAGGHNRVVSVRAGRRFGEVVDCNLARDKTTGKSRGFCFVAYEDQRSTVLAVDNLNGAKVRAACFARCPSSRHPRAQVIGRSLRVDHVRHYRRPKEKGQKSKVGRGMVCARSFQRVAQEDGGEDFVEDISQQEYDARRKRIWDYEKYGIAASMQPARRRCASLAGR